MWYQVKIQTRNNLAFNVIRNPTLANYHYSSTSLEQKVKMTKGEKCFNSFLYYLQIGQQPILNNLLFPIL
jgi:hypothetical protein